MNNTINKEKLLSELEEKCSLIAARINLPDKEKETKLKKTFRNCFMDTAERTLMLPGEVSKDALGNEKVVSDEIFMITGDINAMWLRDSAAQVKHYIPFENSCPEVKKLIESLIRRQCDCIIRDPYANSFLEWSEARSMWEGDECDMVSGDWERKYETDSLSYHLLLIDVHVKSTGDLSVLSEKEAKAIEAILTVLETETKHDQSPYFFRRSKADGTYSGIPCDGHGTPIGYTGMTWTGFRPSDDVCTYGYNIPENLFVAKALESITTMYTLLKDSGKETAKDFEKLSKRASGLKETILKGIEDFGIVEREGYGKVYAYETDGLGNHLLMDDANIPSLLSLPYFGIASRGDELYENTRRFILSKDNPFFYKGSFAKGIGSPHTPDGNIWPMSLIMQGLTSTDEKERMDLLHTLLNTDNECFAMHESFNPDLPSDYTRFWFAWADSLFAEFVATIFND
ncbi:MAG: glycoside hydrolase family 125 protein [Lachnospiraceae bacterium]|nr:glycoside hydrolase family 125 protein [Lachnospiraceae bacterium]